MTASTDDFVRAIAFCRMQLDACLWVRNEDGLESETPGEAASFQTYIQEEVARYEAIIAALEKGDEGVLRELLVEMKIDEYQLQRLMARIASGFAPERKGNPH